MLKTMINSIVAKNMKKKLIDMTISEEDITETLKQIRIALLDADVNLLVVKNFIKNIRSKAVGSTIGNGLSADQVLLKIIKDELVKILGSNVKEIEYKSKPLKLMLVGLQGAGKTTSCAKIAKFLNHKKNKKTLLVALDIYRPAAIDQLRTLAEQNDFGFFEKGTQNPAITAKQALDFAADNNYDAIVFDTAGRLQTNDDLMNELLDVKKAISPNEIILAVDAMAGQDVINVARTFNEWLKLSGCIITKLDSDARAGAVLSITNLLNIPIKFVGTGEKVGSLDTFYPDRMADRILGLGDVLTLAEKANDLIDQDVGKKSMARMMAGKFDLEDMMKQMEQIKKLGSLSSIMKMLPSDLSGKISENKLEQAESKIATWKIMLDSMTLKERRQPELFKKQPNRKVRVIKGSGRRPDEFNKMINEWEKARKNMLEMGKKIKAGRNPLNGFGF